MAPDTDAEELTSLLVEHTPVVVVSGADISTVADTPVQPTVLAETPIASPWTRRALFAQTDDPVAARRVGRPLAFLHR